MTTVSSLPTEVWFCVIEHLDDKEIQALVGVNQFFFNVGMDARYETVDLDTASPKLLSHLDRLKMPQVSKRVKNLTLQLLPRPTSSGPTHGASTSAVSTTSSGFTSRVRTLARKIGISDHKKTAAANPPAPLTTSELISLLATTLICLKNVKDFRIVTWAFPESPELQALYTAAWDTFGASLQRVSLCANIQGHKALIDSKPSFDKLKTLELEFSNQLLPMSEPGLDAPLGEEQVLQQVVVPFVNKLAPQVKTFKMRSWANSLDLSSFFLQLDPFPALESILIRVPFNIALRSDPSGFAAFLRTQTLKKVAFRLTPLGLALDPGRELPLCEWLEETVSDKACFARVESFDICPTSLPGGMNVLRSAIANSAEHLTSFKLRDRYLTHEEFVAVVRALKGAQHLEYLRLNLFNLSAEVFDVLSEHLPGVRRLWLSIGEAHLVGTNPFEALRQNMKTRKYDKMNLWDLTIWRGGSEMDYETMLAIAASIPSVCSFWESGHKGPVAD